MPWLWDSPARSLPPSPIETPRSRGAYRISTLCRNASVTCILVATAILSGVFLVLVLALFGSPPEGLFSVLPFSRSGRPEIVLDSTPLPLVPPPPPLPSPSPPHLPQYKNHDDDYLELEELRDLVGQTKGYFVRDYSLGLGWNNVRYIIEAAVLHAQFLNRTLVLPSFVYARSCEYNIHVCADYAPMVNKGDAIGWDEWRNLPIEQQMAWRIPITTMFNVTRLRQTHPVILVSDYLRLHNLSADTEGSSGSWLRNEYHTQASVFENDPEKKPSLHVIENWWYDPSGVNRVDMLPMEMRVRGNWSEEEGDPHVDRTGSWGPEIDTEINRLLHAALPKDKSILSWEEARSAVKSPWKGMNDEELERELQSNGWEVLYTYKGALAMDYTKHVALPVRQVAPRQSLRGFKEDYGHLDADVVLLSGEIHLYRKPGGLRFTTPQSRDNFSRLVLHQMHPIDKVLELASRLDERMLALNDGRMWMAAHMRRGDFIRAGWVMEQSIEDHLERVRNHLLAGRATLRSIRESDAKTYDVPDVTVDRSIFHRHIPEDNDKVYIATDERDRGNLTYLTDHGVVLIQNLLTIEDRHEFGWPLMITDVLAIVEQATLARAAYFYAHAMSSVAGGVINFRAARGADPRTALVD